MRVFLIPNAFTCSSLLDLVGHWDGLHGSWVLGFRLGNLYSVPQHAQNNQWASRASSDRVDLLKTAVLRG